MFSYERLLNLDMRDFSYWLKKAQKEKISEQIDRLLMTRMAMHATGTEFGRALNALRFELNKLEGIAMDIVRENWEALRLKGRG